jgi:hypothetical protein
MSLPPPRRYRRVSFIVFGLVTVAMVLVAVRRDRLVKPGDTLRFDDFSFTIRDVTRSNPIVTSTAQGPLMVEYVVTMTVDNQALRVPFRFSKGAVAIVEQKEGRRFHVNEVAQKAHDEAADTPSSDPLVLAAGESATRDYVFRVPADVVAPRMRIAPGGWTGLIVDRVLTGSKEFQLP